MSRTDLWSPLPDLFGKSREGLHQVAFFALSPARYRAMGRMGLEPTTRGFGTPDYGGNVARVDGTLLVMETTGNIATQEISTIRSAAEFFSGEYVERWFDDFHDPLVPMDPDEQLAVDEDHSVLIGSWFEFGFSVLDELRGSAVDGDDVSATQIWPEHFDAATELGSSDAGQRATFGASPGDPGVAEPYLYVAPWSDFDESDSYWNASSFRGSILTHGQLLGEKDQESTALQFYRSGYDRLRS
jgi:hypothetical protein